MPSTPSPRDKDAPRSPGDASQPNAPSLPHDRDQQNSSVNPEPDPQIKRAAQDLKEGQVDTDLRVTPGLDADQRGDLVPGGERSASNQKGLARD